MYLFINYIFSIVFCQHEIYCKNTAVCMSNFECDIRSFVIIIEGERREEMLFLKYNSILTLYVFLDNSWVCVYTQVHFHGDVASGW